ncbi:MAG: hypothetical protein ABS939_15370 [Psychrobacillus sp.]
MSLTKTQQIALEEIRLSLESIKKYDSFNDYMEKEIKPTYFKDYKFNERQINYYKSHYENAKNNMVTHKANTRTLEKLSSLGLIEVVEYRENQYDLIKVID